MSGDKVILAGSQTRDRDMCRTGGETVGGQSTSFYRYTDIMDEFSARTNSDIWSLITAKYYPELGYIRVFTRSSAAVDSAVDTTVTKPIEEWERVMREVSYKNTAASYKDRKDFLFSLGPNIPSAKPVIWPKRISSDDVDKINGALGWLGASDRQCERNNSCGPYSGALVSQDPAGDGKWYWVTGPEGEFNVNTSGYSDHEATPLASPQSNGRGHATYFGYDDNNGADQFTEASIGTTTVNGQTYALDAPFTKWANWELNDWSWINEDYLHTLSNGSWNDYTNFWKVQGYLIEYGGMQSDPERRLVKRTSIDTFEFFKNCPPN